MSREPRLVSIRAREIYSAVMASPGAVRLAISEPLRAAKADLILKRLREGLERRGLMVPD